MILKFEPDAIWTQQNKYAKENGGCVKDKSGGLVDRAGIAARSPKIAYVIPGNAISGIKYFCKNHAYYELHSPNKHECSSQTPIIHEMKIVVFEYKGFYEEIGKEYRYESMMSFLRNIRDIILYLQV